MGFDMSSIKKRLNFLFRSTRGLVLVDIAMIAVATAILGTLSSPMEGLGVKEWLVEHAGMILRPIEREGRIIILYHSIAMAVVALETYLITALYPMKPEEQVRINATVTAGYINSFIFGLIFAYFGYNFVFHGLFISGQVLIFFAGCMLAAALWPWQKKYHVQDKAYAHTPGGIDLERVALFTMTVVTLISALFGAVPGSYFGNGFESFLAEDIIRQPVKNGLQLAIIGHLHIMLTLIAIALLLIISRWFDFKGPLHKWAMPFVIAGTLVIAIGVYMVVPFEPIAHTIITTGSTPTLVAALLLVIFGFRKLIRERLAEQNIQKATFFQGLAALLHDPVKFGAMWQMVYMNFGVTFIGIFVAIKLDEIFRVWPAREERIMLTGHWHVLSGIIATILLLYYADLSGLKGRARQWFGWIVIIGSDLAFGAIALFETKRLYVTEAGQQGLVDLVILLTDIGLASVLLLLGILMVWRLVDLFKKDGRWQKEFQQPDLKG